MRIEFAVPGATRYVAREGRYIETSYVLAAELPPGDPDLDDVLVALRRLDILSDLMMTADESCSGCRTRPLAWHRPDCPLAPADLLEHARAEAIKDGMRP